MPTINDLVKTYQLIGDSSFWDVLLPKAELLPTTSLLPDPPAGSLESLVKDLSALNQLLVNLDINGNSASGEDYTMYLEKGNSEIRRLSKQIIGNSTSSDDKMYKIEQWVYNNIPYQLDSQTYGVEEYWAKPTQTLRKGVGDCIANYEEIWTIGGLKKVEDLIVGDIVLSYDFEKKSYCYKPIIKIWEKGTLDTYRVSFRNGTWIDVTNDHPFWVRSDSKEIKYEKQKLKEIDLNNKRNRKIPCVKKLPYNVLDIPWLTEDLCFVIGHFLAEGDIHKSHVRTSGYNIPDYIEPILKKNNIPYSICTNNSNVPYLFFLKSEFKEYLKLFKKNSFDIHIPKEIFNLPEYKLKALIDGHFLGDGHYSSYERFSEKYGITKSNKEKTYSTSSNQLAFDIQRIHLQLGIPIYMWLQKKHKGAGNKPIWRLSYNSKSFFARDYGYNGISEVSIKNIEFIGKTKVRDFTVADTHTFISKFGLLLHNCEDQNFLIHSLGLAAGVPSERLRTYGGLVETGDGGLGGHAWVGYRRESDNEWIVLDAAYLPTDEPLETRTRLSRRWEYVDDFFFVEANRTVMTTYTNRIRMPDGFTKGSNINIYT